MSATTRYRALIIDLDGTLIGTDERISPRVADAVDRVVGRLQITIASGRESSDVLGFARQLGLTAPQISDNGAVVLEAGTGTPLWSVLLGQGAAQTVLDALQDLRTAFIATYPGGKISDAASIGDQEFTRVSALDMEEEAADALVARFRYSDELYVVKASLPYNGTWAVDFTHVGVNKGTAVRQIAGILGIDSDQIIGAGDSHNDLPLLETCGLRIVMGHAPDEIKAIADYVAPRIEDDGLAVAIDEFVIPLLA